MVISEIFKEYYKRNSGDNTIERFREELGSKADKIVLYGAGSAGIAFLYYLRDIGIFPLFFADGNPVRWGSNCEGLEVIDYHSIVDRVGKDALVIVTINTDGVKYCKSFTEALKVGGHGAVHKNLEEAGCKNVIDYTFFRRYYELFRGDRYNLPSCSDVFEMERHEEDICRAYAMLSDDLSKEVFEKIVRFRLLDDTLRIPTEPQDKQYFEYSFFSKNPQEIFVDCGAYNGISLEVFLKENNNKFKKYYGIEPDNDNYASLARYVSKLPLEVKRKVELVNKCAHESDKRMKLYALSGPGSFLADIGGQETTGIRIDDLVGKEGATFIKMNIEGSELAALSGASNTISQCKPRLAIAGYHKTHDLWEVPLMIMSYNKTYRLHLRSYMNNISFIFFGE